MAEDFLGCFFLDKRPIYNYSGKFVIYYLKCKSFLIIASLTGTGFVVTIEYAGGI